MASLATRFGSAIRKICYQRNHSQSRLPQGFCFSNILPNFFKASRYHTSGTKMSKTVLVMLATGTEEIELVVAVDVLRRAGLTVTVAGLDTNGPITCSRNIVVVPDTALDSVAEKTFDAIVLPGGLGGSDAFAKSEKLGKLLKRQEAEGGIIAAICAAPRALLANSIGLGKSITSYPTSRDQLAEKYVYVDDQVIVHDGQFLTSRGPGTAMVFALKLTEILSGADKAAEVAKGMLLKADYQL